MSALITIIYSTTKDDGDDEKEEGKKRGETYNTATIRILLLLLRAIGVASFYSKRSFYVAGAVSKESL